LTDYNFIDRQTSNKSSSKVLGILKKLTGNKNDEKIHVPEGVKIVDARIDEEDAKNIFDCYVKDYLRENPDLKLDESELQRKRDYLVEMAFLGNKKDGIFIPHYLKRLIKDYLDMSEEELRLMGEKEKEKERVLLGFLGLGFGEALAISNNTLSILKYLESKVTDLMPYFASIGSAVDVAGAILNIITIVYILYNRGKNEGLKKYAKLFKLWNELPKEKREVLCYKLDKEYMLPPGSACEFLSKWLSTDENKIEGELKKILDNGLLKKLEEITSEVDDMKIAIEQQQREIEDHERRLGEIEEELEKIKERLYTLGSTRIRSQQDLTENFLKVYGVSVNLNTLVGIKEYDQDNEIIKIASDIIKEASNKVVLIAGEPGTGKSTLLYIIGRELLKQGKKLYLIKNFGKFNVFDFKELGDNAYAIFDVGTPVEAEEVIREISKLTKGHFSVPLIITIRSSYIKDLEVPNCSKDVANICKYEIKMSYKVLLEIARRNLEEKIPKGALTQKQIDQIKSKLADESEGLPLYITEAVKKISSEIGKKNVNEILKSLPEGINALISNIIDSEMDRSPYLLILYYLVSHYPNFPKELISSAETLFKIPRPLYIDENTEEGTYTLHSWYKDITDWIFRGELEKLDFGEEKVDKENADEKNKKLQEFKDKVEKAKNSRFLKENADEYIKSINGVRETLNKKLLDKVLDQENFKKFDKKISEFITHPGAKSPLTDLADVTMLFLIFDAVRSKLADRDTEYGFMIDKERVDPRKLDEEGYQFYNKLVGFLINSYLKNLKEDELLNKPFYALGILYISRLLSGFLVEIIEDEFLGDKKLQLTIYMIADICANSPQPLRLYSSAFVSFLESVGYIKPQNEFEKGLLLYCKRKYEEALKQFEEAIKMSPFNSEYHYFRALTLKELGRYFEALREINKAIELNPFYLPYYAARRLVFEIVFDMLRIYKDVIKEFDKVIGPDPNDPEYHIVKGIILVMLERFDEAIKEFDKAIELNPFNCDYYIIKALVLKELNRFKEALESVEMALFLSPGNPYYLVLLAELWADLDSPRKGIIEIIDSITSGKTDMNSLCEEIDIELKSKEEYLNEKEKKALSEIKNEICMNITIERNLNSLVDSLIHLNKSFIFYMSGKYGDMIEEINKAIELNPLDPIYPDFRAIRAFALVLLGKHEDAIKEFDEAIRFDPNNPSYYIGKAISLKELNRFKEALESVEKALSLSPDNSSYLVLLAELWADLDSHNEEIIEKIRDLIASRKVDKNGLCEKIDKELKEEYLNEKEKKALSEIKNEICLSKEMNS